MIPFPKRRLSAALILLVQLALLAALGRIGASLPTDNSIATFAVAGTSTEQEYALLDREFPASEQFIAVVSAPDPRDGRESAEAILAELGRLPGIERYVTLGTLFPEGVPEGLPQPPLPLELPSSHAFVGYFQPAPDADRGQTLEAALALADRVNAAGGPQLHLAGEPLVNHRLDRGSLEVKFRFFPLLIALSLLLLGLLFRDWRVLLVTLLATGGSLATTTGLMGLMGERLNLVSTLIPALVFVLAVAMQIHVLVSIAAHGDLQRGIAAKLRPNLLISATTFLGFGSLITSQVKPIATMGLYMGLGTWIIFLWAHGVHYGLSRLLDLKPRTPRLDWLVSVFNLAPYRRLVLVRWLSLPALAIIVTGAYCLWINPTESNGLRYFRESDQIRVATTFLESQITGASQLEILIPRPGPVPEGDTDAFVPDEAALARLEADLIALPHVRHLLGLHPMGVFASACEEAGHPPELSDALLEPFLSSRYYRIQLLVDSLDRDHYVALRAAIVASLERSGFGSAHVTGVLDRIMEIQRYLLGSLLQSLALTILTVVALLALLLGRGTPLAALCLPNLLPLGAMAIAMWAFGIPTTISSVMVFSVAFGIAVDDTIHLIHTYRRSPELTHAQRWARTLAEDARAVTLTTLVLTFGFTVLVTSSFLPTQHFGVLMCCGMIAALIGDLVLLPGMLADMPARPASN